MQTIVRLFDNRDDAMRALRALEDMGLKEKDVSIVASNGDSWFEKSGDQAKRKDTDRDGGDEAGEGAAKGAATGGVLGAGVGLLAGLGLIAIPGIGPVVAAGWLAATLGGAAAGAAAGGAIGGLAGALKKEGVPEEDAHAYSEGVRRGGTLLTVRAEEDQVAEIEEALAHFHASDIRERSTAYRADGWTGGEAQPR